MGKNFDSAIVLFGLLALISFDVRPAGHSNVEEVERFKARTDTVRYELTSPDGAATARQRVLAVIEGGSAKWSLVDPDGRTRIQGEGSGNIQTDTGEIEDPVAGTWILTLDLQNATGHYQVNWTAR
jgi:hypothetical protein